MYFEDYLKKTLQYAPVNVESEDSEINSGNFLFLIIPFMMFNSRKRIELQIERIRKFLKQMISSWRIDDEEAIRRNIAAIFTEVHDNVEKLNEAEAMHVKYGDRVMIAHMASGMFLKVEPRA